ncbi:hypothetical protein FHY30_003585 [Xanthomonas arboricola]|uniref:hypothetical protein n=1 Tax=Xanthomonas campestris TaxID=339 RepID=UPI0023EA0D6D|nr:hypothetical protein [Xanthomonas campestris]
MGALRVGRYAQAWVAASVIAGRCLGIIPETLCMVVVLWVAVRQDLSIRGVPTSLAKRDAQRRSALQATLVAVVRVSRLDDGAIAKSSLQQS